MEEIQLPVMADMVSRLHHVKPGRQGCTLGDGLGGRRLPAQDRLFTTAEERLAFDVVPKDQRRLHCLGAEFDRAETMGVVVQAVRLKGPILEQD